MRAIHALFALGVLAVGTATGFAAPPKLDNLPSEIKPVDGYASYQPPSDVVSAEYITESGLRPVPDFLRPNKTLFAAATDGKPVGRYKIWIVAANDKGEQTKREFVVVIGTPPVTPPTNPVDPPTDPVDPPVNPPTSLYFLVVRADGPADPNFTKVMGLPAWAKLREAGHQFKDKTVTTAAKDLGLTLPAGTPLPCVVTLSTQGGVSKIVRPAVPLPTTDAGVAALPNGVK